MSAIAFKTQVVQAAVQRGEVSAEGGASVENLAALDVLLTNEANLGHALGDTYRAIEAEVALGICNLEAPEQLLQSLAYEEPQARRCGADQRYLQRGTQLRNLRHDLELCFHAAGAAEADAHRERSGLDQRHAVTIDDAQIFDRDPYDHIA